MQKFERFSIRYPILFGFILIVLYSLLSTLVWPITQICPSPEGYEVGTALAKFVITGGFILLLWRFGWLEKAGFKSLGEKRIWLLVFVIVFYKAILSIYAFTGSFQFSFLATDLTGAILLYALATSLLEETIYRGLLLTAMVKAWGSTRKGLFAAAILSGLFWASLHFFNLLVRPFPLVALQVLSMAMVGFFYAALVMSDRSIWPAVVIHWATNAAVSLQVSQLTEFTESNTAWGIQFLANLLLVAVGIYLMENVKLQATSLETEIQIDQMHAPLPAQEKITH